jgi:hypothetical protein
MKFSLTHSLAPTVLVSLFFLPSTRFLLRFRVLRKVKKKTFPGGINVISFVSTGRERDDEEEEVGAALERSLLLVFFPH